MIQKIQHYILLFLIFMLVCSCDKKWDEYNRNNDLGSQNLLETIKKNSDLSLFYECLTRSGFDKVIASSKTFTVWAPNDDAMRKVDGAILSDSILLKRFVGNHISNQIYLTTSIPNSVFIKTLNGKNVTFTKNSVDGMSLVSSDNYQRNGVLHIIGEAIIPKPSIWEYVMSTNSLQKQALLSLNYTFFNSEKAEQTGVNPKTGFPIYKPGTGYEALNRYTNVAPITNEDSVYTYILLTDQAFNSEKTKLSKFFVTNSSQKTDSITKYNVISSLAFRGILNADAFPDTIISTVDNVKFSLKQSDIVETHKASNGIVYVMKAINYKMYGELDDFKAKIKPILLEGEALDSMKVTKAYTVRTRRNPDNTLFQDILMENHATASMWVRYRTSANSTKYKVYWRVVRDFSLNLSATATDLTYFPLKLAFNSDTDPGALVQAKPGVIDNGVNLITNKKTFSPDYREVYLGEYTAPLHYSQSANLGLLNLFLVGNNVTTNGANTLLLDYIKLVPVP